MIVRYDYGKGTEMEGHFGLSRANPNVLMKGYKGRLDTKEEEEMRMEEDLK